jgi:hypothetical protein
MRAATISLSSEGVSRSGRSRRAISQITILMGAAFAKNVISWDVADAPTLPVPTGPLPDYFQPKNPVSHDTTDTERALKRQPASSVRLSGVCELQPNSWAILLQWRFFGSLAHCRWWARILGKLNRLRAPSDLYATDDPVHSHEEEVLGTAAKNSPRRLQLISCFRSPLQTYRFV